MSEDTPLIVSGIRVTSVRQWVSVSYLRLTEQLEEENPDPQTPKPPPGKLARVLRILVPVLVNLLRITYAVLPITMIVIGVKHSEKDCPLFSGFPLAMTISGTCGAILYPVYYLQKMFSEQPNDPWHVKMLKGLIVSTMGMLALPIFIVVVAVGVSFLTTPGQPDFEDPTSTKYCDPVVYKGAEAGLVLAGIPVLLVVLAGCLLKCAFMGTSMSMQTPRQGQ